MRRTLLAIAWILALSGCAGAPERAPIVLRKPYPAHHVVKLIAPIKPSQVVSAQDEAVPLSPPDKEALFRAFEIYLNQAKPQK